MKLFSALAATAVALAGTGAAHAQDEALQAKANALGECLVLRTTGADRIALAKWVVTALASVPKLQGVATVTQETIDTNERAVAAIFTRLLTEDCIAQAKPLLQQNAGNMGIEIAFSTLGQIAMQEVASGPAAEQAMGGFTKYLSLEAFAALRE